MPESQEFEIEKSHPQGETHALANKGILDMITEANKEKQEVVPLVDYLKEIAGKPRGNATGGKEDLNSHDEELIIKEGDEIKVTSLSKLQELLEEQGLSIKVLGVQSIGNKNQKVESVVQGVDRSNPKSGFERPVVDEGPHMILAPYAVDKKGQLHLFRTIQMRTGQASIDTPRGFAAAKELEDGQQMYDDIDKNGDKIGENMKRIVSEESGEALKIKRVRFLGSPSVNRSFVRSKSAIFAVEVDYDAFTKNRKVVTPEELTRRREAFEHEGLIGDVLDIPLSEYVNYKRDSEISKDMAADFGTDTVVMDFLEKNLTDLAAKDKKQREILSAEGQANREFKQEDPQGYVEQRLRASKVRHPERYDVNKRKAERFLSDLYRESLKKAS